MMLQTCSDTSCLSSPKEKSRTAGLFFLSNNSAQINQTKLNEATHVLCKIAKSALGLAAKSEIAAEFLNTHESMPMRNTLVELDYKQPATPI